MKNFKGCISKIQEPVLGIFIIIISVIAIVSDLFGVDLPLVTFNSKLDGFILSIFEIQATVSLISIAIISLLSASTKEYMFGFSISKYFMQIRPKIFKLDVVVVALLVLIPVNFICVNYNFYVSTSAILFVSILLVIIISLNSFVMLRGTKDMQKEISAYILNNINDENIHQLEEELRDSIESNNSRVYFADINLLIEMFSSVLDISIERQKLIDSIEVTFIASFNNSARFGNEKISEFSLRKLLEIYEIANNETKVKDPDQREKHKNRKKIALKVWDNIFISYYQMISNVNFEDHYLFQYISNMRRQLYANIKLNEDSGIITSANTNELERYSEKVYYYLTNNRQGLKKEFDSIFERLYRDIAGESFPIIESKESQNNIENCEKINEYKMSICQKELWNLTKGLVLNKETDLLNRTFKKMIDRNTNNSKPQNTYILQTVIFIYFISCDEKLIDETIQQFCISLISKIRSQIKILLLIKNLDLSTDILAQIETNMWSIGMVPTRRGNGIYSIESHFIREFFVFTLLSRGENSNPWSILESLIKENPSKYYSEFAGDLKKITLEKFRNFKNHLFSSSYIKEDEKRISQFESFIIKLCKIEAVEKNVALKPTAEEVALAIDKVNQVYFDEFSKVFARFSVDKDIKDWEPISFNMPIQPEIFYSSSIKEDSFKEDYTEIAKDCAIGVFHRKIISLIEIKRLTYSDKNKIETFFSEIGQLGTQENTLIGNIELLSYEYNDSQLDVFNKFTAEKQIIDGYEIMNYLYLVDTNNLFFTANPTVIIEDYDEDEILKDAEMIDENYMKYHNGIPLIFTRNELIEYCKNENKKIIGSVRCLFGIKGEKIGAGIEMKEDDFDV